MVYAFRPARDSPAIWQFRTVRYSGLASLSHALLIASASELTVAKGYGNKIICNLFCLSQNHCCSCKLWTRGSSKTGLIDRCLRVNCSDAVELKIGFMLLCFVLASWHLVYWLVPNHGLLVSLYGILSISYSLVPLWRIYPLLRFGYWRRCKFYICSMLLGFQLGTPRGGPKMPRGLITSSTFELLVVGL